MKPVGPEVQVANMNDSVSKDVATAAAAAANEISEPTDIPKENKTPSSNVESSGAGKKAAVVVNMTKSSQENEASSAGATTADASANEASEGSDIPDEQKSLNRDTEASETELAAAIDDASEPLNAKQSGKKKKGRKTNWTSVPLEFPPHRPTGRGKGRKRGRGQGSIGPAEERERRPEVPVAVESLAPIGTRGRGGYRGSRRGGRGRMQQYYREQSYLPDPSQPFYYYPTAPPMSIVYKQLKEQVEFYFYNPKLAEDFFLRRNMDSHGFVDLNKIGAFDQIAKITQGLHNVSGLLVQALQSSELLELSTDKTCVRRKFSPEKWILGSDPSVFSSLRPDAPEFVFEPAGSKKIEKKESDDTAGDAKENGESTKETTPTVAQNSDFAKKTADDAENSTDPTPRAEFPESADAGNDSVKTAEPANPDVKLADDIKPVDNTVEEQDSDEKKDSESREQNDGDI